jgi:hypothetical protein
MTVMLTVRRAEWEAHVDEYAGAVERLIPVVKGNGYGFGRAVLHPIAAMLADRVCVGSVHELDHIPPGVTPIVLTPTLRPPPDTTPILTVGAPAHVDALDGWPGRVVVKLRSSMRRYGVGPDELPALLHAAGATGLTVAGAAIHLPLAGDDATRRAEIECWLDTLPAGLPLSVSHLDPRCFADLRAAHPDRLIDLRAGTGLWHGDKSFFHLGADVLDVRPLEADAAGYHATPTTAGPGARLVLVGAGTVNGVAPLTDGRSPFHFLRHRLALLEPPHMHTAMCVVPAGAPVPAVGDTVDLQRPLITTTIDELVWT